MCFEIQYLRKKMELLNTPIAMFSVLTDKGSKADCLLLESGEPGGKHSEKSILIVQASLRIRINATYICFEAISENGKALLKQFDYSAFNVISMDEFSLKLGCAEPSKAFTLDERLQDESIFSPLRSLMKQCVPFDEFSAKAFMFAGLLGYDLVDYFEQINDDLAFRKQPVTDDLYLIIPETRILVDHLHQTAVLEQLVVKDGEIKNLFNQAKDDLYQLEQTLLRLKEHEKFQDYAVLDAQVKASLLQDKEQLVPVIVSDRSDEEYKAIVNRAKAFIKKGDVFQIVPSRTFSCECNDPLFAYYCLTQQNPSPYQFYFNSHSFTLFGASPESAVKYNALNNNVEIYPIAGTIARGKNAQGEIDLDLDNRLECQLRLDEKEQAEHMMLVDLARNDIARIAISGTRHVAELLKVDRYSHIMHLVSRVLGKLKPQLDAFHAYQACLNMGTLTGAPKIRATELIRYLEGGKRGYYGGAIGYFDAQGSLDSAIIIRSAVVQNNLAKVTAGAGIVADSIPQKEADETLQKASAVLRAITGNPILEIQK